MNPSEPRFKLLRTIACMVFFAAATRGLAGPFSVVLFGDSPMCQRRYGLEQLYRDTYGLSGYGIGRLSIGVFSGASAVAGQYSEWINGDYFTLPPGGYCECGIDGLNPVFSDSCSVYYLVGPSGGTFSLSYDNGSDRVWVPVATNIACEGGEVIGAARTFSVPLGRHSLRIDGLTGTCKIIGVALWDSSNYGVISCMLARDGHEAFYWTNCPATIYGPILESISPRTILSEWKEIWVTKAFTAIPVLEHTLRAYATNSLWIYSTAFPTLVQGDEVEQLADFLRHYTQTNREATALFDGYWLLCPTNEAFQAGLYLDAVHLSASGLALSNYHWFYDTPLGGDRTFEQWIASKFPAVSDPLIVGPDADPDRDGVPNLVEFAFGGNPRTVESRPAPLGAKINPTDPAGLDIEFVRPKELAGISYSLKASIDLANWLDLTPTPQIIDLANGYERVLISDIPMGSSGRAQFFRLSVGQQQVSVWPTMVLRH